MSNYKNYTSKKSTTTKASKLVTPQSKPIPGREAEMAQNNAGGYTFVVNDMSLLDRFLILGTDRPVYTAGGSAKLTESNAQNVIRLVQGKQGVAAVNRIVEISDAGRAPKNDSALFALALTFIHGTPEAKNAAALALPKVARTGTHLFTLASYIHDMRGWGRTVRRGFSAWYNDRSEKSLATQLTKYASRNGWSHRDVLRLAHVRPNSEVRNGLFAVAVGKETNSLTEDLESYFRAVQTAKTSTNEKEVIRLITQYGLSHEMVNTELLNSPKIWEAMLPTLGLTALIRNLGKMTSIGMIGQTGEIKKTIMGRLTDAEAIQSARIHPLTALSAQRTYQNGHGLRGSNVWSPVAGIVSALEDTFYAAFKTVEPTNKSRGIFLDTSGSMCAQSPVEGLTCRDITAVMSMLTVRTEKDTVVRGFSSGSSGSWSSRASGIQDLNITAKDTLEHAVRKVSASNWGGTDCSLPMVWAKQNKISLDSFEIYTDNDTWAGVIQPVQALRDYRKQFNRDAKMVVAATLASPFTIADPNDNCSMDVVGFDSASPNIISDFVAGRI